VTSGGATRHHIRDKINIELKGTDQILAEKVVPDRQLFIDAEQQANVFHADAGQSQRK
jgi:hypothetical protein